MPATQPVGRLAACLFLSPLIAPPSIPAAAQSGPGGDLAIEHVNVVDTRNGRVLPDQTVVISSGSIVRTGPAAGTSSAEVTRTVDGRGKWLIPGLWDMHAHLRANGLPGWVITDWMMPLEIANGVTGARDMNSDCENPSQGPVCLEQMRAWQDAVRAGTLTGPRLVALSSFPINPPWDFTVTEQIARGTVRALHERGVTHLKIYNRLAPDALAWMTDEAAKLDMDAWGHVPLRMTAAEASDAGMRSIEHARDFLFDCFPGSAAFRRTTTSTDPDPATMRAMVDEHDPARCREEFATLIRNGTWYVPTHVTRRMDAMAGDSAFRHDPRGRYIPPPLMADWLRDADRVVALAPSAEGRATFGDFYRKGLEITGNAHRAGVRILVGTDGGDSFVFPGFAVHDELEELVRAGLTPAEALRAATWSGAEFLGMTARHGSVEPGRMADLVLLDANPLEQIGNTRKIRAVILGGRYFDRAALDTMLERAEAAARRPIGGE